MSRPSRRLLIGYVCLSFGLSGLVVAALRYPLVVQRIATPAGWTETTYYGVPLPYEFRYQQTDAAGRVMLWVHSGRNEPLAVALVLAAWVVGPGTHLLVRRFRRSRPPGHRAVRSLVRVGVVTAAGGIVAAGVTMEVVGWSRIVFDQLGIDPPQLLMTGLSDAHYRLENLYRSTGLDRRQFWTHYAWLTGAGMGFSLVGGVMSAWLSDRWAKRSRAAGSHH